ncbi:hypothetical protein Emag_001329 [Eimeria magna]
MPEVQQQGDSQRSSAGGRQAAAARALRLKDSRQRDLLQLQGDSSSLLLLGRDKQQVSCCKELRGDLRSLETDSAPMSLLPVSSWPAPHSSSAPSNHHHHHQQQQQQQAGATAAGGPVAADTATVAAALSSSRVALASMGSHPLRLSGDVPQQMQQQQQQ